jgi:6-phosphogluconolactonase/glucosamine-6-phosphate isomerase/deaminase
VLFFYEIQEAIPASILRMHPNLTVILDQAAAILLEK